MVEMCLVWIGDSYEEMVLGEAKQKKLPIILCQYQGCNQPAAALDPSWPYYWDRTRCADHLEK